jgi:Staphylococcal nuclease homologue
MASSSLTATPGYVWESDKSADKGKMLSLELVRRGLAFPFLFESAGDYIPQFLTAARSAIDGKKGVWKHYRDEPLTLAETYDKPKSYATPADPVFRRVVDAEELEDLTLPEALRKYDVIDYETGNLVTGDRFTEIDIKNRVRP